MTEEQIRIAQFILDLLKEGKNYYTSSDIVYNGRKQFNEWDLNFVQGILESMGITENQGVLTKFTVEGLKASEMGFEKYLKHLDKKEKLDYKAKEATVRSLKWYIIATVIASIISIIAILISLCN